MEILDAYLEHLRQASCSTTTIAGRRRILTQLDRQLPYGLTEVSRDDLGRWLHRPDWSRNTRATYWAAIRSFYGWATDPNDPWLSHNPTAGMVPVRTAPGIARPVTDEQLHRILTEAAEPYRLWALIAAYQGLRCVEIAGLDREHVTEAQLIVVHGKGGRPRAHDTHLDVWTAVRELPPGPVARMPDGQRATAYQVSIRAALHFRRHLRMPGVSMHRLRHWLGTTVQREYRDIRVTQQMLGHASLTSTQVYTDATPEQQRAAPGHAAAPGPYRLSSRVRRSRAGAPAGVRHSGTTSTRGVRSGEMCSRLATTATSAAPASSSRITCSHRCPTIPTTW
ncbi:MAG TPA: tyrosine-type recombinase/integrase [Micromonosporaceae bacterium]|nr:tyrosine-type recombinase/integrase [Micromonosporaceae bacterium]